MFNPVMIQLARESRGWTQKDLANAIGASQGAVSKYEIGALAVPQHHVEAIAEALRFTVDFFEESDPAIALGGDFLYRKNTNVTAKARRRVEAEANIRKLQVKRLLRSVEPDTPKSFPQIQPEEKHGRIERVAQEVRKTWRIPSGPIQSVTRLLENHGAIIFLVDFGSDRIDGTNLRKPGLPPLFFMNGNVPGDRHRFSLAHELGHVVMHENATTGDPENEANTFAREFLMPRADIRSDLKGLDLAAAARLKQLWGVSMQAIIYHAHKLGVITQSRYRRVFTSLSGAGSRVEEPHPLKFEQPELFEQMLQFHKHRLGWSDFELGDLLYTNKLGEVPPPAAQGLRLTGSLFSGD